MNNIGPWCVTGLLWKYYMGRQNGNLDILKALHDKGICYGIRYDVIDNVASGNSARKPLLIANGKKMVDGKDGWYEYFFRTQVARTPKQLEDGITYISELQGVITFQDYQLNVSELLIVEEVNIATGDVAFDGNVLVEGNVFLRQGMNGSGNGFIHAAKDVIGNFRESIHRKSEIQWIFILRLRMQSTQKKNRWRV